MTSPLIGARRAHWSISMITRGTSMPTPTAATTNFSKKKRLSKWVLLGPIPDGSSTRRFHRVPQEATDILAPHRPRLYHEVETPCAEMTPEERRRFRQAHATPLLEGIFAKIEELRPRTTPSEPFADGHQLRPESAGGALPLSERRTVKTRQQTWRKTPFGPIAVGRKKLALRGQRTGRPERRPLYMGLVQSCKNCERQPLGVL